MSIWRRIISLFAFLWFKWCYWTIFGIISLLQLCPNKGTFSYIFFETKTKKYYLKVFAETKLTWVIVISFIGRIILNIGTPTVIWLYTTCRLSNLTWIKRKIKQAIVVALSEPREVIAIITIAVTKVRRAITTKRVIQKRSHLLILSYYFFVC